MVEVVRMNQAIAGPAATAQEWHEMLMANKERAAAAFVAVGMALWNIKWQKDAEGVHHYEALGYESFEDYLAEAADMQRSNAYRILGLYQTFFVDFPEAFGPEAIRGVDMQKLEMIRPVIGPDMDRNAEWLERARALGRIDLRALVHKARGKSTVVDDERGADDGADFAQDNKRLAVLHGQIVRSVRMGQLGLVVFMDSGTKLRVHAVPVEGGRAEVRYEVSERR